jgi:hypothetical protein
VGLNQCLEVFRQLHRVMLRGSVPVFGRTKVYVVQKRQAVGPEHPGGHPHFSFPNSPERGRRSPRRISVVAAAFPPGQARDVERVALVRQPCKQVRAEDFVVRMSKQTQDIGHNPAKGS